MCSFWIKGQVEVDVVFGAEQQRQGRRSSQCFSLFGSTSPAQPQSSGANPGNIHHHLTGPHIEPRIPTGQRKHPPILCLHHCLSVFSSSLGYTRLAQTES
jgi:hypothetical protein